jgi:hypothetical protein
MNVFLITVSVLAPFGWFIYKMLRYTAKSLGDESPLAIVVTYKIEDWQHFTRFDYILNVMLTLSMVSMLYANVFVLMPAAKTFWHWIVSLGLLAACFYALWYIVLVFKLDWQYWLITRNKTVTLDPTDKSLTIDTAEEIIRFSADDVREIEKNGSGLKSSKMVAGYSYLIFRLKDGQAVYLNLNKSYLDFALEAYFKTVPIRYVPHKIPWIVDP